MLLKFLQRRDGQTRSDAETSEVLEPILSQESELLFPRIGLGVLLLARKQYTAEDELFLRSSQDVDTKEATNALRNCDDVVSTRRRERNAEAISARAEAHSHPPRSGFIQPTGHAQFTYDVPGIRHAQIRYGIPGTRQNALDGLTPLGEF